MTRVTDDQVSHMLTWARNFGDLDFKRIGKSGRKWLVTFTFDGEISTEHMGRVADARAFAQFLGPRLADIVPHELALTNREAMLLCYGLAVGGWRENPRAEYRAAWNRGEKHPVEAARQAANKERLAREWAEQDAQRDPERERRAAATQRRGTELGR